MRTMDDLTILQLIKLQNVTIIKKRYLFIKLIELKYQSHFRHLPTKGNFDLPRR